MTAIQPCALLLLVGPDWRVETVSANVAMLGDFRPSSVVGQPLADLIGSKSIHSLRNRLAWLSSDDSEVQDHGVQWGDTVLDVRAIREHERYLVEAELSVEPRLPDGIGMVRSMSDRLSGHDPRDLAEQALRQLSALTGFDQLAFCDCNGAVIAAVGRSKLSSFDAMDADPLLHVVADRDADPVALVGDESQCLLTRCAFLAPDEDQRERFTRLGIGASMSMPLRIDGEFIGTLHAYHPAPRRCSAERRSVAHLFVERVAARMARHGWKP